MKKLNNKGLTLVELVIAIGMSTIVIGAATLFLYNAERSYRISQYSVDLQMESQILMEQLSNWVMESNRIEIADGGTALVLYRMPTSKLVYTSGEPIVDSGMLYYRTIVYCRGGKLYAKFDESGDPAAFNTEIEAGGYALYDCLQPSATLDPEDIIGEHVQYLDLYVPNGADASNLNAVEIKLSLKEGNQNTQAQSYIVSDVFSLRNSVYKVPTATIAPSTSPDPDTP
ncbi:MAG: prepilin-type N-terminal cleavage/methylation domain-containing protein [Lachnospiraceae bacterium]|nr:prepilin-type N-terminal cleavage/methylation domain-containing protein [Lachnospiraceae bacterium]